MNAGHSCAVPSPTPASVARNSTAATRRPRNLHNRRHSRAVTGLSPNAQKERAPASGARSSDLEKPTPSRLLRWNHRVEQMLVIDRARARERHLMARFSIPAVTGFEVIGFATGVIDHFQLPHGTLAHTLRRHREGPRNPGFHGYLAEQDLFDAGCQGGVFGDHFDADAFRQSPRLAGAGHCQKREGQRSCRNEQA